MVLKDVDLLLYTFIIVMSMYAFMIYVVGDKGLTAESRSVLLTTLLLE